MKAVLLAWGADVSPEFAQGVCELGDYLGCDPNWLMACMKFESGLNPAARNSLSGATGLIQFMPSTARNLGTTCEALRAMSPEEQLPYVRSYFEGWRGRLHSLEDLYMAILWPLAVGKPDDFVLFRDNPTAGAAYRQNRGLDANHDGAVTKAEAAAGPRHLLAEGLERHLG